LGEELKANMVSKKNKNAHLAEAPVPSRDQMVREGMIIFGAALLVRLVYFFQLKASPFFYPIANGLDPELYVGWAREIASGDWIGKEFFIGMPLYAYFLAMIFLVTAKSVAAAILSQLALGAFNCWLVYRLGLRLFGRRVALIAGSLSVAYLPMIFNDGQLTSTTLTTTLNLLFLYGFVLFEERRNMRWLVASSVLLGISTLVRANTFAFLPCLIAWMVLAFREVPWKRRLAWAGVCLVCFTAPLGVTTLRNYLVTGHAIAISPYGGINFYIGNNPEATGRFVPPPGMAPNSRGLVEDARKIAESETGASLSLVESDRYWMAKTWRLINQNWDPFVQLLGRKVSYFFNAYEFPDILDYYFTKRYVGLLSWPGLSFVVVGPLGLAGMFLVRRRSRALALVYFFFFSYVVSIVLFFVNSRYRITVLPALFLFAGVCLESFWEALVRKNVTRLGVIVLSVSVFWAFVNARTVIVDDAMNYNNLGIVAWYKHDLPVAQEAFLKAVEMRPAYPEGNNNLGAVYFEMGDFQKAEFYFGRAVASFPSGSFRSNLAKARARASAPAGSYQEGAGP
jgi:4-amino-4-deoxy-L-arabinose transferase-like glycosyltransferase